MKTKERDDPKRWGTAAVLVALAVSGIFALFHASGVLLTTVDIFDDGLQLASGSFVSKGLIAFRDYYVPYGPANAYLLAALRLGGFDSLEASRTLFLILNAGVAGLGTYLIIRRTGIASGAVFGLIVVAFPPSWSYTGVVLLVIASYLTAIGWKTGGHLRPLVDEPSPRANARLLIVGILLAMAVWFRWEFAVILVVWLTLILQRPRSNRAAKARLTLIPLACAAAPYIAVVGLGGGSNLLEAIRYALFKYPRYRGLPFPTSAPWELFEVAWTSRTLPLEQLVYSLSFFAVGLGLLLLAMGPVSDRYERIRWVRTFEPDETRMILIVGATAAFLLLSLRTRPDLFHANQLMALGWLAVLWNRPRYRLMGIGAAVVIVTMSLVVIEPLHSNRWAEAYSLAQTTPNPDVPRLGHITIRGEDHDDLQEVVDAWIQYRHKNPSLSDDIFVANRSNSLTFMNSPIVYWLLDARPAHWLTTFDPGFADQEPVHLQIIRALCQSGAALVLREPIPADAHLEDVQFSDTLDVFIERNYVIVRSTERYDLLRQTDTACQADPTR